MPRPDPKKKCKKCKKAVGLNNKTGYCYLCWKYCKCPVCWQYFPEKETMGVCDSCKKIQEAVSLWAGPQKQPEFQLKIHKLLIDKE